MRVTGAQRARTRRRLLLVILATIPCYCIGLILINIGQAATRLPNATGHTDPNRAAHQTRRHSGPQPHCLRLPHSHRNTDRDDHLDAQTHPDRICAAHPHPPPNLSPKPRRSR